MALADFNALRALILHPHSILHYYRTVTTNVAGEFPLTSSWFASPLNLAPPTTSVALDGANAGAPRGSAYPTNNSFITKVNGIRTVPTGSAEATNNAKSQTGLIIDRLNHSGGLSGNIITSQTTNLPTATLTRYTSGVGVYAALHIITSVGATDSVATVTYTNSAGTAGRTGTIVWAANTPGARTFYPVPLQADDLGVKSVESVVLSVATGAVGNFGVVLFKPLAFIPMDIQGRVLDCTQIPGWNSTVEAGACLEILYAGTGNEIACTIELASV